MTGSIWSNYRILLSCLGRNLDFWKWAKIWPRLYDNILRKRTIWEQCANIFDNGAVINTMKLWSRAEMNHCTIGTNINALIQGDSSHNCQICFLSCLFSFQFKSYLWVRKKLPAALNAHVVKGTFIVIYKISRNCKLSKMSLKKELKW